MPLTHLLYRCPRCGHDPMKGKGDEAWCASCGTSFSRDGEGGGIRVTDPAGSREEIPGHHLASGLDPEFLSGRDRTNPRKSRGARVTVRRAVGREGPVYHGGEVVGFAEELGGAAEGVLELNSMALILWGEEEGAPPLDQWALQDIRAVQATSGALQISPITGGVVHFRFLEDSPRRWEDLLHRRLRQRFRADGLGEILEFQPRIVVANHASPGPVSRKDRKRRLPSGDEIRWRFREPVHWPLSWYGLFRSLAWLLMRLGTRTRVRGVEHIPREGPFILVANHQSVLDPILVQVACPRPVHTLTKSTQFSSGLFRWLLPRVNAIPTRRYCIEPQAVRVMIRRLAEGRGVGIYPEGERSWDGVLQPFRRGTLRFLLRAGVPIVPCGVSGTYDAWPRWSRKIRRKTAHVTFGEPLEWPALNSRWAAEAALDVASRELEETLAALGAWTGDGPGR